MAQWTIVEGTLSDGRAMRLSLAEHEGKLWHTSMHDDDHPLDEDDFVWRLGSAQQWTRAQRGSESEALAHAVREVEAYFAGRQLSFDAPIELRGTSFQLRVWRQLLQIPFARTYSYGEIAEAIGHPAAFRAVGNANGKNNIPLFVPCHRVLAAGGKLGGFTGGIGLKKRLLAHEAAIAAKQRAA